MKRLIGIILLMLFSVGCSKTEFVVLREVPSNPSFQVVPTYIEPTEITYANNIERALIGCGVKVLVRPQHKEVTTEKVFPREESKKEPYETRKIEYTFEYDELKADYLVQTYYYPKQIKITKVATQEILTVFGMAEGSKLANDAIAYRRVTIFTVLSKLGILNP